MSYLRKASLLAGKKPHVPKAVFETISQFFIRTVSWIYIQFFASDAKEKCNDFEKISSLLKILRLSESIQFQKFNHLCI